MNNSIEDTKMSNRYYFDDAEQALYAALLDIPLTLEDGRELIFGTESGWLCSADKQVIYEQDYPEWKHFEWSDDTRAYIEQYWINKYIDEEGKWILDQYEDEWIESADIKTSEKSAVKDFPIIFCHPDTHKWHIMPELPKKDTESLGRSLQEQENNEQEGVQKTFI